MFHKLASILDRHPVAVVALLFALTAAASGLATQLQFEFSPQALLRGSNNLVRELEACRETFAAGESVVLVVIEATGEADVLDPRLLNWEEAVGKRFESIDGVDAFDSVATMEVPGRTFAFPPQLVVRPVIPTFPADADDAERLRRFLEGSSAIGTLVSEDRRVGVLLIDLAERVEAIEPLTVVIDRIREQLHDFLPPAGYQVSLSGLPFIRADAVASLRQDQERLLPLSGLFYLLALVLVFRRLAGALLPLLAVGMSLAWVMGIMVLAGSSFNLISNVLPILLIVIGMSNCVHVLDAYAEELPLSGSRREAARHTTQYMSRCCLLTLLTTGVGFLCLIAARADVLRQFAWQAAVGIVCMYFAIIGTFGTMMRKFRPSRRSDQGAPLGGFITWLDGRVIRNPLAILIGSGLVVAGAIWSATGVRVNSSIIETYDEGHPTQRTLRLVEREMAGLLPIEVHLQTEDPHRLLSPEIVRHVEAVEREALKHPEITFARSYVDVLESLGDKDEWMNFDDEELSGEITRRLQWLGRIGESVGFPRFMTADRRQGRILFKVPDAGTRKLRDVIDDLDRSLHAEFPPGQGVTATLTGDAYVNTMAMNSVIHDLFFSLLTASAVIFALIAIVFRSLRTGLIASVPNLTPLALTMGYMGLRGFDMNVGNVIVFTISLGIAVDDSIHFLFRFREECKKTDDVSDAVRRTFAATGRPILVTSILIVSGLSVLLLSNFLPTRRFAELTSVTMIGALLGDLLLLPACLLMFWPAKYTRTGFEERKARREGTSPSAENQESPPAGEQFDSPPSGKISDSPPTK